MPIFLDEDMIAGDPAEICYPHLVLCMGVTVKMSDGYLFGAHVTEPTTEALVLADGTVIKWLDGKSPKKVIYVRNKMINIVV